MELNLISWYKDCQRIVDMFDPLVTNYLHSSHMKNTLILTQDPPS